MQKKHHTKLSLPAIAFAFIAALAPSASAQDIAAASPVQGNDVRAARAATTPGAVTVAATQARVRFAAPSAVVQLRLEVFNEAGRKVYDTELRGGNVIDWNLTDGQGVRVAAGTYAALVTVKGIGGRLSQTTGLVAVTEQAVSAQPASAGHLSAAQSDAIGPVEEGTLLVVAGASEPATITANNGREGQIIRTRGPLTFRVGDFFTGSDQEQMRLTEDGNLGIGTRKPQAKLDVAGDIHAAGSLRVAKGIEFPDGSVQTTANLPRGGKVNSSTATDTASPLNPSGTGTQDHIVKWMDNAGTLGDSVATDTSNGLAITSTAPALQGRGLQGSIITPSATLANDHLMQVGGTGHDGSQTVAGNAGAVNIKAEENWSNTANGSYLSFETTPSGSNTTARSERMRITGSGNVGIGTSSPTEKLHVNGNGLVTGNLTVNGTLSASGSGITDLNASNITSGTLDNARLGVVSTANGGTGLSSAGNAGNFLRSDGGGWTSAPLSSSDIPAGSANYIQNTTTQQTADFNISGNGIVGAKLGVGTATPSTGSLHVYASNVATHNDILGLNQLAGMGVDVQTGTSASPPGANQAINGEFLMRYNPGSTVSNNFNVFRMLAQVDSSVNASSPYSGQISAGNFQLKHGGANALTGVTNAIIANVEVRGTGSYTGNAGSFATSAFRAAPPAFIGGSTGTIAKAVGLFIDTQNHTRVAAAYGIWQHSAGDKNYFAGSVGIGTSNPQSMLHVNGTTTTNVLQITGGADLAEGFDVSVVSPTARDTASPEVKAGMVVSIDSQNPGKLLLSRRAYDRRVAGVVSGAGGIEPGMVMGQHGSVASGKYPVALTGRVYCWVDASYGVIRPGDLLTTSRTPGHAMKVTNHDKAQGAIIGKAMTGLKAGKGLVLVLVSLQ